MDIFITYMKRIHFQKFYFVNNFNPLVFFLNNISINQKTGLCVKTELTYRFGSNNQYRDTCFKFSYKETSLFSYSNYNACIVSIKHIDNIAFVLVLFVLNSTDYYDIVFVLFCCFFVFLIHMNQTSRSMITYM